MKKKRRRSMATAGLDTLRYAEGGRVQKKLPPETEDHMPRRNMMATDDPTKQAKQVIPNVYRGKLAKPGTEVDAGSPDWKRMQLRI